MKEHERIAGELSRLKVESDELARQMRAIQERCTHPRLPKHEFGEEYRDICPDCGFVAYCYRFA